MTDKRKYTFVVETTISLHVDVEAATLEEAVKKAQSSSVMSLCWSCSRSSPREWSTSGELDCDPTSSPLADAYVDDESLPIDTVPW